jgi:Interferon-induced transmembrane protein/GYF domain 2
MSQYYYTDGKERFGPFSVEELQDKNLTPDTLVWKEGLVDWVPARNLQDLQSLFDMSAPFPPPVGMPLSNQVAQAPPKNWLIESILVTILCCLPLGIVGIIYASRVDTLWKNGQWDEAYKASQEAGKWVKMGLILGVIGIILYILLMVFGVIAGIAGIGSGMEV